MSLEIRGLEKRFGTVAAVRGIDLDVRSGEFFTLLGPSGCGKTTILRSIAGIYAADRGHIRLDGRDITSVPMHGRDMAMVFQNYALFPHMTVAANVAFGLQMRNLRRRETAERVAEALALVRLEELGHRYPAQLSGGQQQRVALARALVIRPKLLLLDEPLSNLDARLRDEMRTDIRALQRRLGVTTLLVTHDIQEAFVMSDRVAVLRAGGIDQIGTPRELYQRPANRFVGPVNEIFLPRIGRTAHGLFGYSADGMTIRIPNDTAGDPAWLILRPESLRFGIGSEATENAFDAIVDDMVYTGATTLCQLALGEARISVPLTDAAAAPLEIGARLRIGWNSRDSVVCQDA